MTQYLRHKILKINVCAINNYLIVLKIRQQKLSWVFLQKETSITETLHVQLF
jgi:hypothetical protein